MLGNNIMEDVEYGFLGIITYNLCCNWRLGNPFPSKYEYPSGGGLQGYSRGQKFTGWIQCDRVLSGWTVHVIFNVSEYF
jgi:hypothetical protein